MDFWDLTKLLVRRWAIALPMLALSAALTVLTVGHVKPDYVATAYVSLVPPVLGSAKPGEASPDQRNPWLSQGLQTIGNAAIITVLDQTVVKELEAAGYSDSYTVEMGSSSPLVSFEVVGNSRQQARDTAEQLVERFNQSVAKLQSDFGVTKADSISTRRLDLGTNVKVSNSKVKRALVAVAGAGLLLTAAVTVGADAWLRRHRRRAEAAPPSLPATPISGQVRRSQPAAAEEHANAVDERRAGGNVPATLAPASSDATARIVTGDYGRTDLDVVYQSTVATGSKSIEVVDRERDAPAELDVPADATVVLPLSLPVRGNWPGRNGDRKPRA